MLTKIHLEISEEDIKQDLVNFDMLTTFSFGVSSNLLQQKSPAAEIIGIYFLGTIVPKKYKPIISAVGLFCCDKYEETPNEKVVNMSQLTKSYFRRKGSNKNLPRGPFIKDVIVQGGISNCVQAGGFSKCVLLQFSY